jgi:hypothetical protein
VPAQYERGSWEPEGGDHGRIVTACPGLSRQKISSAEGGARLAEASWQKLADALGVPVEQIRP